MRLIDADKLELKETVRIQLCGLKEYVALYSFTKDQIEEAPTINAIPIEWIRKQIEEENYRMLLIDHVEWHSCLSWLLEKWEKENETDRC